MAIVKLRHTTTAEEKSFNAVEKDYILMIIRLINNEEAEDLLYNEYRKTGDMIRYDLGVNIKSGKIELNKLYGDMYIGFNDFIPILSLDVRRGDFEFFYWVEDENDFEDLNNYLDLLYL